MAAINTMAAQKPEGGNTLLHKKIVREYFTFSGIIISTTLLMVAEGIIPEAHNKQASY